MPLCKKLLYNSCWTHLFVHVNNMYNLLLYTSCKLLTNECMFSVLDWIIFKLFSLSLWQAKYDARQSLKQQTILPYSQKSWQEKTGHVTYPSSPEHTASEQKHAYSILNGFLNGGSHTVNNNTISSNNKNKSSRTGNLLFVWYNKLHLVNLLNKKYMYFIWNCKVIWALILYMCIIFMHLLGRQEK